MSSSTNTWVRGCGKALFVVGKDGIAMKIDPNGQFLAYGLDVMAEELCWYDTEKFNRLEAKKKNWAEERGMTIEDALRNYEEWSKQNRPARLLSSAGVSLRERRATRVEAELAARENEREEQRRQLEQIREELRRAKEARQAQGNR